ncbi:MAG TPA: hypothetical protein VE549_03935 [Myxococcaceae bacterium]|nr:hypothetical protein [Myxococcaceae bacterium]
MGEWAALAGLCVAIALTSCAEGAAELGKGGAGQAGAQRPTQRVRGTVNALYPSAVLVEDNAGRQYRLQVGPETTVRRDGQGVSLLELEEGARVEAQCVRSNGGLRAIELSVSPP